MTQPETGPTYEQYYPTDVPSGLTPDQEALYRSYYPDDRASATEQPEADQ